MVKRRWSLAIASVLLEAALATAQAPSPASPAVPPVPPPAVPPVPPPAVPLVPPPAVPPPPPPAVPPASPPVLPLAPAPADLTLENFFTAGWQEPYQPRPGQEQAERILLFRTPPPFLDRAVLLNYDFGLRTRPERINEQELGAELLLPLNRRLLFQVAAEYNFNGDDRPGTGGASGAAAVALQLVDTTSSALNLQASLSVPGRDDLLPHRLEFGLSVAGFQDLGRRFGAQGSFGIFFPLGSSSYGANLALAYSAALTKTLTGDLPWLGHFTPFVEAAGTTTLGVDQQTTQITLLPGAEWEVLRHWWLALAVEIPLTGPRPFDLGVHVSLIKSF